MFDINIIILFAILAFVSYYIGRNNATKKKLRLSALSSLPQNAAKNKAPGKKNFDRLYALPRYYGYTTMLWSIVPTIFIGYVIINHYPLKSQYIPAFLSDSIVTYLGLFLLFLICSLFLIKSSFNAQKHIEGWIKKLLILSTLISVSITALIFFSVLFESIRFFEKVNFFDFLFGLEWSPQTAIRADQAGGSGSFGIIPVFLGTLLITFVAMFVAAPLGLMSAIYLSEYSSDRFRMYVKPILEILAGIPTVVYGYFAAVTFGPFVRDIFESFGFDVASESAFAAGFVMGIMIIPYMMSLTDDVMNAVPKSLRDASLGLGATKSETIVKVVIPAALPGIMGAFLLAVSRAIGETMIVTMAAGLIAKLTLNPFDSVTTVTAQIVKLLVGDQEFDSAKTLAAFALSLTLFIITLLLNVLALMIVKKYRERYE